MTKRLPEGWLTARGAIRRTAWLGVFAEGGVIETCSTSSTAVFRLLPLDENPGARRCDGFHHGLLAVSVICAVVAGCRGSSGSGNDPSSDTSSASTSGEMPDLGGSSESGSDDSSDHEEYCNLSGFEVFDPVWIVEAVDGEPQRIDAVVLADDSVFVVSRSASSRHLERKTVSGERTWLINAPKITGFTGADESHLYYLETGGDILRRRALADGVRDEDWYAAPPSQISSVKPRGEHLMVGGLQQAYPDLDAPTDARFTLLSKAEPNTVVADWTFGESEVHEAAAAVSVLSSGVWLGNVMVHDQPFTRLVSLGGSIDEAIDVSFAMNADSWVISLHERPAGMLLFGTEMGAWSGRSWVLEVGKDGTEQWRKPLAPCGSDIDAFIADEAVIADDGVWILFHVATGSRVVSNNQPLLVRLSLDGEVEAAWRFGPPHATAHEWNVLEFVGEDDTMVVSMFSRDYDAPNRYWVARLR